MQTTTKAKIRYKTDEGEVNKKGGKKLRTRSLGNIDPGIGEEKAKRSMLALGMLIVFPIVSIELVVKKIHNILAPQTRKEELEEKEQELQVGKEAEEAQAIQSTSAQVETVQTATAIIGEPTVTPGNDFRKEVGSMESLTKTKEGAALYNPNILVSYDGKNQIDMTAFLAANPQVRLAPPKTTAEVGYVAPLSYADIPGYAEQIGGVGF